MRFAKQAIWALGITVALTAWGCSSSSRRLPPPVVVTPPPPVVTPPTLTIDDPLGGEIFFGTRSISWTTTSPAPGTVEIRLSSDSGATFPTVVVAAAADTGTYAWDTTLVADGSTYRLRLLPTDAGGVLGPATDLARDITVANTGLLYALEFEAPIHTVGAQPALGGAPTPIQTVSAITMGTPTIVASFNGQPTQALEFDSFDLAPDQISLSINSLPASNTYSLSFDLVLENVQMLGTGDVFTVFVDAPSVRILSFNADLSVEVFANATFTTIGSYTVGTPIRVRIDVDLIADTWQIFFDGTSVHAGPFGSSTAISTMRFATANPAPPSVQAVIDNVSVIGS